MDMLLNDLKLYGMSLEEAKKMQKNFKKVIYQIKPVIGNLAKKYYKIFK